MSADQNLLLGFLALQCGFISKDQLVVAFSVWTSDKSKSLESILAEQQALSESQLSLLAALVLEHLKLHGEAPEKSLAAIGSASLIKQELEALKDSEIVRTLVHLSEAINDPNQTISYSPKAGAYQRFVILRPHAKGGLGQVSVALDSELNRHVALKEILPHKANDSESQGRFLLEAEITGQLEHPGIVPVYGLGTDLEGRPYYAMRFVEGDNLKRAIDAFHKDRKPNEQLSGARAVDFRSLLGRFIDVCNAIEYAHSRQVLHRDLKPENILLGPYGETLVVDWGLAKALNRPTSGKESAVQSGRPVKPMSGSHGETIDGSAIGTPAYMSPEQADGKIQELGPATDIYALGSTLYSLITGQAPVKGDHLAEVLEKVRHGDIVPPRNVWSSVPRPLEAICLKAMATDPSNRYGAAKELANELEKWLADEPVAAYLEPFTARARRWIKRHPALVSASAACTLLGLAGALILAALQGAHAKELEGKNKTINNQIVEVTKRKEEAEKERARAEEREKDAIAAVKRFGDAVSGNEELKNNPKFEALRKELLKEPLGFFRQLNKRLQADGSTREESLGRLASAAFELGKLTDEIGDKQDAIVAYGEAISIQERLAREHPSVTQYHNDLANSHHCVGNLLRATGKPVEAKSAYERAISIFEQFARENQVVTEHQCELALTHIDLGTLLAGTGKISEGLEDYDRAKSISQRLVQEHPEVASFQSCLANSYNQIGYLLSKTGKLDEALAAYNQAKTIRERLAEENPSSNHFQRALSNSHLELGALLHVIGKKDEALAAYEQAKSIQDQLVRQNPSITEFQSDLGYSYHNLGVLFASTGRLDDALDAYDQAKYLRERLTRENTTVTRFQGDLASTNFEIGNLLAQIGQRAEGMEAYEKAKSIQERLVRENPTVTKYKCDLATSYNAIGSLFLSADKRAEALAAYKQSKAIQERLALENPSVTEFQNDLAACHHNVGILLNEPSETLAAYEQAKIIWERLARENPSVTKYQNDFAHSHYSLGVQLDKMGRIDEALAAYEQAKTIQEKLARENPSVIQFQRLLAFIYFALGEKLDGSGKTGEALAAHEQAKTIREKLAIENPSVTEYQIDLAYSHHNLGNLLSNSGKPFEAITTHEKAKKIRERLALDNPSVIKYQSELAYSQHNLARLLHDTGKQAEALAAYDMAKSMFERLSLENPSVTEFHRELAHIHNNLGNLVSNSGKPSESITAYEQAKTIRERLALENPSVTEFQSDLGATLDNLGWIHLDSKRFAEARDLLNDAIKFHKAALNGEPHNAGYRQSLRDCYSYLIEAAKGLKDASLYQKANSELYELMTTDPQFAEIDQRLKAIANGEVVTDAQEALSLGKWAYDLRKFTLAARLYGDAVPEDAASAEDRELGTAYNASCCAALAAMEKEELPELDEAARQKLRVQALGWLKSELEQWQKFLNANHGPEAKKQFTAALLNWQQDFDLASLRDADNLAALPESERREWEALWARVAEMLAANP